MKRELELSGVYYRIQRNGRWVNVDFVDMDIDEQKETMSKMTRETLENLVSILADTTYQLGSAVINAQEALGMTE